MATLPTVWSIGPYATAFGVALSGSAGWPSANLIIYVPVRIPTSCTALRVFWSNGWNISGNVNIGLYDSAGTKQWELGSTAHSGANVVQFADMADQAITAGLYYIAMQESGATGMFDRYDPTLYTLRAVGIMQEAAASFALPATATFAKLTYNYLPSFGLDMRGSP